ncbi:MAG: hypothetical protein RLZZ366_743, partial [Pseudomonadota bacterium]
SDMQAMAWRPVGDSAFNLPLRTHTPIVQDRRKSKESIDADEAIPRPHASTQMRYQPKHKVGIYVGTNDSATLNYQHYQ